MGSNVKYKSKNGLYLIFTQAIQDITRIYDNPPEQIVTLIYERIDVNNEGMTRIKMLYAIRDSKNFSDTD